MRSVKFKTTINCSGCVAAVTPTLDQTVGKGNWQVDTAHPDKVLTVNSDSVTPGAVVEALDKAGFRATVMEP